jgi:c-di-GMP-binding flagellar brake protein YcgR
VSRRSRELQSDTGVSCVERRAATRYRILQRCCVYPAKASAPEAWQCMAYNISATGIGMALPIKLQEGTVLRIQAWRLPQACPLQVRIVRTTPVEFLWFTGCQFLNRLSDADLTVWRRGSLAWLEDHPS